MTRRRLRRWSVPLAALGTILVPMLIGGCFDARQVARDLGLEGCEECIACVLGEDVVLDEGIGSMDFPSGDEGAGQDTGVGLRDDTDASETGPLQRPLGSKVPQAVTQPRPEIHTTRDTPRLERPPTQTGSSSPGHQSP